MIFVPNSLKRKSRPSPFARKTKLKPHDPALINDPISNHSVILTIPINSPEYNSSIKNGIKTIITITRGAKTNSAISVCWFIIVLTTRLSVAACERRG